MTEPPTGEGRFTPMCCATQGCDFDGSVPRRAKRRRPMLWTRRHLHQLVARVRPWTPALSRLGLAGLSISVGAAAGAAWHQASLPTLVQQRATLPPGEYHDGDPLPVAHILTLPAARANAPLDLRGACVWGRPGRDPYRGSVAEALRTAQLPAAVQAKLIAKVAANQPDARLIIANDGIRSETGTRRFSAESFAMTYGRTMCLEARVNFPTGHTEPASLYEVQVESGRRYSLMIPDVCGNVSIIADASSSSDELLHRRLGHGLPSQLYLTTLDGGGEDDPTHVVPAPSTLGSTAFALEGCACLDHVDRRAVRRSDDFLLHRARLLVAADGAMIIGRWIGLDLGYCRVREQPFNQRANKLRSQTFVQLRLVGQRLVYTSHAWVSFVFPPAIAASERDV